MAHFVRYFYDFYDGAVWSNVFVIVILGPLGYLWSKTKWWPLKPVHGAISRLHVRLIQHQKEFREHRRRLDAHNEWSARHLAQMYEKHTGKKPTEHPHFDLS